jgi:hypothetical protein
MRRVRKVGLLCAAGVLGATLACAQFGGGGFGGRRIREINNTNHDGPHIVYTEEGVPVDEDTVKTARETAEHSSETPNWTNAPGFEKDVFTFTRIKYKYGTGERISFSASRWGWITDYPDSDLNLSLRVQQMTSIRTDPEGRTLKLTEPELFDYPWIYMVEVGRMTLRDEEVLVLRKYLTNGGVLMADDFWGWKQWDNFEYEMKRVLPEREFVEISMTNELFRGVFDLSRKPKNKLQTPNSRAGAQSLDPNSGRYGVTWEYHDGEECTEMHVRAIYDDQGRIMVIATHNCDNGDGWEREGEDDGFFHEFSEKRAFPLGIDIIFHLMTH